MLKFKADGTSCIHLSMVVYILAFMCFEGNSYFYDLLFDKEKC